MIRDLHNDSRKSPLFFNRSLLITCNNWNFTSRNRRNTTRIVLIAVFGMQISASAPGMNCTFPDTIFPWEHTAACRIHKRAILIFYTRGSFHKCFFCHDPYI